MTTRKLCLMVTSLALVSACSSGGNNYMPPAPPPVAQAANFTNWSKQEVFARAETATPTETESVVFNFDGDNNPDAYTDLLPPGT